MSVTSRFDDRLEPAGIAVGALLVVVGIATIAGAPWATKISAAAAVLQVVGAIGTAGVGVLLIWLSRTD